MATRKRKLVDFDASRLSLNKSLLSWLASRYPTVDPIATFEIFTDKARALGWIYADWHAAFRNYIRNGEKFGGVVHHTAPEFVPLIQHAKAIGFRMPHKHESSGVYRTALNSFDKNAAQQLSLGQTIKRFN